MESSDHKIKRYDRQLRIWGIHGQQRLESCRIALLNCGPTGSETLKNLVLGGIAAFTIVDGSKVSTRDLGNNFLVDESSLGESRAKCVTRLLQELNEVVAGSYVEEDPEAVIANNPQFFSAFDFVIATQMRDQDLFRLDDICRHGNVQLLILRSYGLVGYLRISVPEHRVVESKPENQVDDLRLHEPWPELYNLAVSFDLSKLDDITHKHLPYAYILIQAAEGWKKEFGRLPSTSKERSAFKEFVTSMKRSIEGIPLEEENFDEAVKAAFHVWTPYNIPSEVNALLVDERTELTAESDEFWIMVAALKAFVNNEGNGRYLPLEGSVPDMHSTTELYLTVQRLYRERAEADVVAVEAHVATLMALIGRGSESIPRDTVRLYCKNARNLRVIRYRPLAPSCESETPSPGVLTPSPSISRALLSEGSGVGHTLYVLLRAVDWFYAAHGRYPGATDGDADEDVPNLKTLAMQILAEMGWSSAAISDDYVMELCRCGAAELHVVGALLGGMAAQEAIKLITHQFVPAPGVLIYNGITCTTFSLDL